MSLANKFNIPSALFETIKKMNEGKAEYQAKVKALMAKRGIKSLADLSPEEKKDFFNTLDSMHKAKNEEVELDEAYNFPDGDIDAQIARHDKAQRKHLERYVDARVKRTTEKRHPTDPTRIQKVPMGTVFPAKMDPYKNQSDEEKVHIDLFSRHMGMRDALKHYKKSGDKKQLDYFKKEYKRTQDRYAKHPWAGKKINEEVDLDEETQTYMVKFEKNGKVSLKNYEAKSDLDARSKAKVDAKRMGMNVSSVRLKEEVEELDEISADVAKRVAQARDRSAVANKVTSTQSRRMKMGDKGGDPDMNAGKALKSAMKRGAKDVYKEEVEQIEEGMSTAQIKKLRDAYGNIDKIDVSGQPYKNLVAFLDKQNLDTLKMLAGAKIKFISPLAQNRVVRKMNESIGSTIGRAIGQYAGAKMGLEGPGGEHGALLGRQLEMFAREILKKLTKEEIELTESHFKVGQRVECIASGMKGTVTKVDPEEKGKYYTVKQDSGKVMKYAPDELKALSTNEEKEGASKKKENEFHKKLDKLVHKTFGHSSDEKKSMKEEQVMVCKDCGDEFDKPTTDCPHDSHDPNGKNWVKKEMNEGENKQMKDKDPCWKGYQMVGMKKKGGKEVPNCVPVAKEEYAQTFVEAVKKMKNKKKEVTKDDDQVIKSGDKLSGKQEPIELDPELKEQKT